MSKFRLSINGVERDVEVTKKAAILYVQEDGGEAIELRLVENRGLAFVLEVRQANRELVQIRGAGNLKDDNRQLWVNGRTFTYQRIRQRSTADALDASLSSSIPAVVSQILVSIDDIVAEGDKLILLESMKMVIPISAPCDARVNSIHCAEGDSVQAGVQLIDLEEIE